jgi:hypothetical protein
MLEFSSRDARTVQHVHISKDNTAHKWNQGQKNAQ